MKVLEGKARELATRGFTCREILRYRRTGLISRDKVKAPKGRSEHTEQAVFFGRVDWMLPAEIADCVYAVPNGGKRDPRTAARMKAEGVKPGMPDVNCDVAASGWHGLRIELKREKGGSVSPAQRQRHGALRAQGFRVEVAEGADAAWAVLCEYLGRDVRTGAIDL